MRGDLRIISERSPYMRAGLSWPTGKTIEISIVALDGARLLRLARDPVLRIEADVDGAWRALPALPDDITIDAVQLMIDTIAAEIPAADDTAPDFTIADALAERDQVSAELATARAEIERLNGLLDESRQALNEISEQLGDAEARATKSADAVDMLQAENITLKRAAAEHRPAARKKAQPLTTAPAAEG